MHETWPPHQVLPGISRLGPPRQALFYARDEGGLAPRGASDLGLRASGSLSTGDFRLTRAGNVLLY